MIRANLRWYLGVMAVVGSVPCVIHLGEGTLPSRVLAGVGLLLMVVYAVCALAYRTACRRRWVVRGTGAFAMWSALVLLNLFASTGDARGLVVPWTLFVLLPSVQAFWVSQEQAAAACESGGV